jgi:hypothetical protein
MGSGSQRELERGASDGGDGDAGDSGRSDVSSGGDKGTGREMFITSSAYAKPEDWELNRAHITRLYRDEDLSLKEVIGIMAQDHHFFATCVTTHPHSIQWHSLRCACDRIPHATCFFRNPSDQLTR